MILYEVLKGKKITGRHAVYREGQRFPEAEAFGDMDHAVENRVVRRIDTEADKPASKKSTRADNDDRPTPPGGGAKRKGGDR